MDNDTGILYEYSDRCEKHVYIIVPLKEQQHRRSGIVPRSALPIHVFFRFRYTSLSSDSIHCDVVVKYTMLQKLWLRWKVAESRLHFYLPWYCCVMSGIE